MFEVLTALERVEAFGPCASKHFLPAAFRAEPIPLCYHFWGNGLASRKLEGFGRGRALALEFLVGRDMSVRLRFVNLVACGGDCVGAILRVRISLGDGVFHR